MKKITLVLVLASGFAFAQTPTNYTEVQTSNTITNTQTVEAVITRVDNSRLPIIDTYTTMVDFDAAVTENCNSTVLISEDFTNGPAGITPCGPAVSSDGDGCFAAGELEDGFIITASGDGGDVINIPGGAIGNIDSLMGASTFADFTIVSFDPPVYAIAADVWENNDPTTTFRIFDDGGTLIESFDANTPVNSQTFVGFISDEPISSIEIEGANGSGELFGNFFFGADCMELSVDDSLQQLISIYPNPTADRLTIGNVSNSTINTLVIYDCLGKSMEVVISDNQVNVSKLQSGVYFIKIETTAGTLTKKFIKK